MSRWKKLRWGVTLFLMTSSAIIIFMIVTQRGFTPAPVTHIETIFARKQEPLNEFLENAHLSSDWMEAIIDQLPQAQEEWHTSPADQLLLYYLLPGGQPVETRNETALYQIEWVHIPDYVFRFTSDNGVIAMEQIPISHTNEVIIKRGTIQRSWLEDSVAAGVPEPIATTAAELWSSQVDFSKHLHPGDPFVVVYLQKRALNYDAVEPTQLLYASLETQKYPLSLLYAHNDTLTDYMDKKGSSLTTIAFQHPLRKPTRISSPYGMRKHPILKIMRMHGGIDYAARMGTPIVASASGRIKSVGLKGGYGKAIEIQHNYKYMTLYGHMSRFAKGIKKGVLVKKGQVIGYVGSTGRSTAPHLHFEVRRFGKHMNPAIAYKRMPDAPTATYARLASSLSECILASISNESITAIPFDEWKCAQ